MYIKIDKNWSKTGDFKCLKCGEWYCEDDMGNCSYLHCAYEDTKDTFKCLVCGCEMIIERKRILKYKATLKEVKIND